MIHRLIIQELSLEYDEDKPVKPLYDVIDFDLKYNCMSMGFFTNITEVKKSISKIIDRRKDYGSGYIINIYTRDIIEGNVNPDIDNDEFESYTFFDENGNVLSSFKQEEIRNLPPKYSVGDIILCIPDTSDIEETEIGIISSVPSKIGDEYTILLGTEIHNHCHTREEFLHLYDTNKQTYLTQTLTDRLTKIGY